MTQVPRVQICHVGVAGSIVSVSAELQEVDMLLSNVPPSTTASTPAWRNHIPAQLTVGAYHSLPSSLPTQAAGTDPILARVFSDAPDRVASGRFFLEVLQVPMKARVRLGSCPRPSDQLRLEVGRLRELTLHRSVMDHHTFVCLFALPHTQTLQSLCLEESDALLPWKLRKLECAWLLYAIFHPFSATSSWRRLELRNCDPSCLAEALDLPHDRKLEIVSVTRLFQLQRNKKRERMDLSRSAVAGTLPLALPVTFGGKARELRIARLREGAVICAFPDPASTLLCVVETETADVELCDLQTTHWVCMLVPGLGFGWVRRIDVELVEKWTPGGRQTRDNSAAPLVPSLTSLVLKGECLTMARTQSLVRALGPSLESLDVKTGRIYSYLLKDIAESCPRLRTLAIKTKMHKLKGSALRQFFSDTAVARHMRSLTLSYGISNPRVLLSILANPNEYAVANALEKLHLCYVRTYDCVRYCPHFLHTLRENLVLEKLYLSGDALLEQLGLFRNFDGEVVAFEKTIRARLAFLSVVSTNQQLPELSPLSTLAHGSAASDATVRSKAATLSSTRTWVAPARAGALGSLSVDLIKIVFAFSVTQRVIGAWPPALPVRVSW